MASEPLLPERSHPCSFAPMCHNRARGCERALLESVSDMAKQILVVDDEERIQEIVCACLEDIGGWKTAIANSGQAGWQAATALPPDAILLDVSMPDMDGVTLYKKLQAEPTTQGIPVVFLTAKVLPADMAKFRALGVAGVITKPFNPLTLVDELTQLLGW